MKDKDYASPKRCLQNQEIAKRASGMDVDSFVIDDFCNSLSLLSIMLSEVLINHESKEVDLAISNFLFSATKRDHELGLKAEMDHFRKNSGGLI